MDIYDIGETIRNHRRAKRIRQVDLAAKAGVSRSTLVALENGKLHELGIRKIEKLLAILDLRLTTEAATARRPTLEDLVREQELEDLKRFPPLKRSITESS
ncbi:MAG: helix-turn-helix domain-containing protein [Rhodospirillales bacterium]|nr:helix-turn-helix domain-containing protein [Rhodospirillales bacterium]